MKIERRKNASRNIITGFLLNLFRTLVPFALRSAMIDKLGMDYVGLDSLFVSILHVLNLAELGVGSAMVYSMYKPIADDDSDKLCALLNLYKKYYNLIGFFVLGAGLVIIPILPKLIEGSVPQNLNLYVLYIINLLSTVASYWLFAYRSSLLMAHQRNDVYNKIQVAVFSVRYCIQLVAVICFRSFYIYAMTVLFTQLLTNVAAYIVTNKMYPYYKPEGKLTIEERRDVNRHIKDLFTAKLGSTVTNSADAVVISAFLGLTVLGKYNNYYYILSALFGFMTIIFQSCLAGIGNSLVVETPEKNFKDFQKFSMLLTWIIGFCTACLYCLLQPFMKIWETWLHTETMLNNSYVALFCLYFFVYELALVWATYKDAGGIWHNDRFRPLCVTIVNLGLNLLTVRYFGLYGVILSTVVSYVFVGMPWILYNIFTSLFRVRPVKYLCKLFWQIAVTILACLASGFVCNYVEYEGITGLLFRGVVVTIVSNFVFCIFFYRMKEFGEAKSIVTSVLKRLFSKS